MPWATFTAHRHQPNWTDVTPTALADFLLVLLRKIADAPVDNGTVDHALHEAFADLASQFQRPPVNFRSAVGHQNAPHAAAMMPKPMRSAEHTSELQSLMRISYAVFCLHKKTEA